MGGYGNWIQLSHENNIHTRYAHLKDITVHNGQNIRKGDLIGYSGNTGGSTAPHLHFELRSKNGSVDDGRDIPLVNPNTEFRYSKEASPQIFDSINDYKSSYTQKAQFSFLSKIPLYKQTENKAEGIAELNSENFKDYLKNPTEETGNIDQLKEMLYKGEYKKNIDESIANNWNKLNEKLENLKENNELSLDEFEAQVDKSLKQFLNAINRADD
jgi:hypothetical protein